MRNLRGVRAATAGLSALLLLIAVSDAAAQRIRRADGDTSRTVERISISDEGIEIRHSADGDRVRIASRPRQRVEVGARGIRVESSSDTVADFRTQDSRGITVTVDEGGLVRVFADAEVEADERIDGDVVAVFGSARVAGEVTGDVVAVFGSVRLEPGASIAGDVVSVGGLLDQAPDARVRGESVSLSFLPMHWGAPGLEALVGVVIVTWLLTLIMGSLLHLLFPTRMLRVAVTSTRRPAASFFLGFFSAPLVVITIVLLIVTVIGIPFAVVLPLIYLFGVWVGQIAITTVLGSRLLRRRLGEGSAFLPLCAGTVFVAVFFVLATLLAGPPGALRSVALFLGLLGVLLVLGLSAAGTGAVLLSGYGSRPRDPYLAPDADDRLRPEPLPHTAAPPATAPPSPGI